MVLEHAARVNPRAYSVDRPGGAGTVTFHPTGRTHLLEDYATCPLELAARVTQEDLCLVRQPPGLGNPARARVESVMQAGVVCFSFGRLPERMGEPMSAIHSTVGGYERDLQCPVVRRDYEPTAAGD